MTQEVFRIVRGMDLKSIENPIGAAMRAADHRDKNFQSADRAKRNGTAGEGAFKKNRDFLLPGFWTQGKKMTFLLFRREQLAVYLDTPRIPGGPAQTGIQEI